MPDLEGHRAANRDPSAPAEPGPPPSMADFDKKLAETDSYLQVTFNSYCTSRLTVTYIIVTLTPQCDVFGLLRA